MGSSFTGYRGHGFSARDGILETWLAALADVPCCTCYLAWILIFAIN
jgi:hypothetical protein